MELQEKYKALLNFVETIADESVYETYENLNELNWEAHEVLNYIGEFTGELKCNSKKP